jgi:hypothetical protein
MFHLFRVTVLAGLPVLTFVLLAGVGFAQSPATPRLTCEIENTAKTTTLIAKARGSDEPVSFRIDWLSGNAAAENFRNHPAKGGALTSTHRLGQTTVTRTILAGGAEDCIIIHVIADQPGAVSLDARFVSKNPARIANRREILLSGEKSQAHAWILPFESDVHDDGKGTVSLHGEGEALIILNLTADPQATPISDTLRELGKKYDPTHSPPGPHRIWEGVREGAGEGEKE